MNGNDVKLEIWQLLLVSSVLHDYELVSYEWVDGGACQITIVKRAAKPSDDSYSVLIPKVMADIIRAVAADTVRKTLEAVHGHVMSASFAALEELTRKETADKPVQAVILPAQSAGSRSLGNSVGAGVGDRRSKIDDAVWAGIDWKNETDNKAIASRLKCSPSTVYLKRRKYAHETRQKIKGRGKWSITS